MSVRAVAYCRRAVGEPVAVRVTQQLYDVSGRLTEQRDPRLFALAQSDATVPPNLTTIPSLSGQPLGSNSVDAGWQRHLPGASGQASESWDQRGWHRRIEYDSLLRPVAVFEHFAEDAERCAERITWGCSSTDDALHNRCGQPVRQDDPAGSRLIPDYGISGAVLAEVRHFLYSLDPPDWPVSEVERNALLESGHGARSAWRFAATGEAQSQTDTKGHVRQFAHDRAGQLREIRLQRTGQTAAQLLVSAIEYNASGQVQQELAGNGMRSFSSYDPADGHLLSLANQAPDGVFLQNLGYHYDPVGNITQIADAALPTQHFANQRIDPLRRFEYDTLYQLIKATGWETAQPSFGPTLPDWIPFGPPDASRWCNYSETYAYDAAGNLLKRIHLGAENDTLILQVAAYSNRSIKDRPDTNPEALFDARGNLRVLQPGQGLQWNGRNELAQVTQVMRAKAADDQERYVYDSSGQRMRKWCSAAAKSITHTTEVRYLPGIELHTNNATGEAFHVSTVEAGRCSVRLLHWDSPPPDGIENDQLRFCFDDHLGSTAVEVDEWSKAISQEVFYPYGGTAWRAGRHEVETGYKTIRYSGKERDATGLYYYGARYYAPWLQRWLNPDPAGDVDGLNFYRFSENSPITYVDRLGNYSVFAAINDFIIESYDGIRGLVVARGFKEVRIKQPEVAKSLDSAFFRAKSILANAVEEIQASSFDERTIQYYVGDITKQDLSALGDAMIKMKEFIGGYGVDSEKVVLLDGDRWEGNNARIFKYDRRSKIYFNTEVLKVNTVEANALMVLHEISHLVLDTKDYWYLMNFAKKDQYSDFTDEYGMTLNDNVERSRFMYESKRLMQGDVVSDDVESKFTGALGGGSIKASIVKFKASSEVRTQMALNNADTFASVASALSIARSKRALLHSAP
ncbi:RHS repeat-associated core domain-containing protein [Pseudomonas fluorescens]|uniref:RHS repeat-associated core domain-containing protein n=1 Tax=Pseudomonas fluorescens TaxID=294 RepID=UPI0021AC230D|nr:RHS repeat-associated core domain-containing protein [Pseudomonas fluorescens]